MSQQDKIFIGRCFNGNFQEGSADIKYLLDEEALMQLFNLMKEAKSNRDSLPAGVTEYNGNLQINLRLRTNRAGDKCYCELDTWKPDTQKKTVVAMEDPDDLPF